MRPTPTPTYKPTANPTPRPTPAPIPAPSYKPTPSPSLRPTISSLPTYTPTSVPTNKVPTYILYVAPIAGILLSPAYPDRNLACRSRRTSRRASLRTPPCRRPSPAPPMSRCRNQPNHCPRLRAPSWPRSRLRRMLPVPCARPHAATPSYVPTVLSRRFRRTPAATMPPTYKPTAAPYGHGV